MREIYPFKDDETRIQIVRELKTGIENQVQICTVDAESGVEIVMTRKAITDDDSEGLQELWRHS